MESVLKEDVDALISANHELLAGTENKSFLITGATGMIGRYTVSLLAEMSRRTNGTGQIIANVRDKEKAEEMFAEYLGMGNFKLLVSDVTKITSIDDDIDFILHAASPTQPQDFLEHPVDIIGANVFATNNLLRLAHEKMARFCLLSTLEVYGTISAPSYPVSVSEEEFGALNSLDLRSTYPESKRLAENLCVAYATQHGVSSTIVRIAPVISPIIDPNDKRVFAQFVNRAATGQDITVFSDAADKKRSYTYIADAVSGILTALLRTTKDSFVFNLANNDNVASIRELAEKILSNSSGASKLNIIERESDANTSSTTGLVLLDSQKLMNLGWTPRYSIDESIAQALKYRNSRR